MRTCSAPMHTEKLKTKSSKLKTAFTLTELVVVILIVSLLALLAQLHLFGLFKKHTFKAQLQEFISTMQMTAVAATESG